MHSKGFHVLTYWAGIVVLSVLLLMPLHALSASGSTQTASITQFTVTPKTCMAPKKGDPCPMAVSVQWQATSAIKACFYQDKVALHCWSKANSGAIKIPIKLLDETEFSLVDATTKQQLVSNKVTIQYAKPKKFRRRLRAEWSIF